MEYFWYIIASIGAGIGTGLAGLSAATVMVPILLVLCPSFHGEVGAYQATAIALASDILGSAVTTWTYMKHKNIDLKRGWIMFVCIVSMCIGGSFAAFQAGNVVLGGFSLFLTFFIGIRFLVKPETQKKDAPARGRSLTKRDIAVSLFFGLTIGFGTGFVGTGGGMMMLVVFTAFLGMDHKTAVGTSTFIMTFTALIAAISHMVIEPTIILERWNVLIVCIVATTVLYYITTGAAISFDMGQVGQAFKDFAEVGVVGVFKPESWVNAFSPEFVGGVFSAVMYIITFCLVDMFDTIGTLYGTATQADMLDENGDPIDLNKCMACDSIATLAGAALGTSTCTTFVESASGVAAGGRTGLTSLVTAGCFFLCLFLTPLASIVPSCATAPALIYVGVLMLGNFKNVDMSDMKSAAPAFLTLIMMPLTYSIANGIGIGAIAYTLIAIFTGEFTKKDIMVAVIGLLFCLKFIFITM